MQTLTQMGWIKTKQKIKKKINKKKHNKKFKIKLNKNSNNNTQLEDNKMDNNIDNSMGWIKTKQKSTNQINRSQRKYKKPQKYNKKNKFKKKISKIEKDCQITLKDRAWFYQDTEAVENWKAIIGYKPKSKPLKCQKCTVANVCSKCFVKSRLYRGK